ncbi:hypothetical protein J6590_076234, partial [Homalodisca vitripennis]
MVVRAGQTNIHPLPTQQQRNPLPTVYVLNVIFGHSVEAIAFPQCSPGIYTVNGPLHVEITWAVARPKICQFTAYVTVSIVTEDYCWTSASLDLKEFSPLPALTEESRTEHLPVFQGDMTEIKSAMTSWVLVRRQFHPPNLSILNIRPFLKQ